MGFFGGKRSRKDQRHLEQGLRDGLASFGSRSDEVARWVLTGLPEEIDLTDPTSLQIHGYVASQSDTLMSAIGNADPIVEWRLGLALTGSFPSQGGLGLARVLCGLRSARGGSWPDDARIAAMLAASGGSPAERLESLLNVGSWTRGFGEDELRQRPSFDQLVRDHPQTVRDHLTGDPDSVAYAAKSLTAASVDALVAYSDVITGLMTDSSKKRRAAGALLASQIGYPALAGDLQQLATEGDARVRTEAVRALGQTCGEANRDDVIEFLEANCSDDRSAGVRDAISDLVTVRDAPPVGLDVKLPEPDSSLPDAEAKATYEAIFDEVYRDDKARYERAQALLDGTAVAPQNRWALTVAPADRTPQNLIDLGWRYLCDGGSLPVGVFARVKSPNSVHSLLGQLAPLHACRLAQLAETPIRWGGAFKSMLVNYPQTGHPTAAELQAAAEGAGFARREVMASVHQALPWSAEDTWPWVAALLPEFMEVITAGEVGYWDSIDKYYDAISCLPNLPGELRQLLLNQAISGRKAHRPLARGVLADDPDLVASIIGYLGSRKYGERAEAARWLADLGDDDGDGNAIKALQAAATKENHDVAKGAILTALERFGEPIDAYLDRENLLADATKGLAKKLPAAAEWIQFETMPALRWSDGTPVDSIVVKWFVVQAVRLKSPAPSPVVRRLFEQMDSEAVDYFANSILSMWLAEDLRPVAAELAASQAHFAARRSTTPVGSATSSKGLLSLVAAGGGGAVVAPAEAYLRKWYGMRASQCRALVEVLAWIDDPVATQLVLSIGSRFRTKGIQQEAIIQAELLAERNGWTLEDLAYRTVPSGGFDAEGAMVLDYGDRQFTARLADDLSIVLWSSEDKRIKALPAQRKDEDEDLIKLAKNELAGAKKQIKAAAKEQPLRLHEAMCVQRRFEADDFHRYILEHPVMSRLATRLVWVAIDPSGDETLFRPLSDGTLLNANDDDVSLESNWVVRLAHSAVEESAVEGSAVEGSAVGVQDRGDTWSRHFADYQVAPLFPQFGRPELPAMSSGLEKLTTCQGAMFDDRRLRSVLRKIGYDLGPGEDGGSVAVVRRRFPSAGIEARISVRGLYAMIMQQEVALEDLHFGPLDTYDTMLLADVPPVLLAETIADVDVVVAASDGIAEDWENRVR